MMKIQSFDERGLQLMSEKSVDDDDEDCMDGIRVGSGKISMENLKFQRDSSLNDRYCMMVLNV